MLRFKFQPVRDTQLNLLFLVTGGIFLGLALLKPEQFLSPHNLRAMSFQFPEFALLSLAVAVTILTGGIDLSIVSTALLSATLGILLCHGDAQGSHGLLEVIPSFGVTLLSGAMCGFLNGILITRAAISPILATLGTMQLFSGLTVVLTGGTAVYGFPDSYLFVGNGSMAGVPVPLLLFVTAATLVSLLLSRTAFGFRLYLLGNNPKAARFAGINTGAIVVRAYVLSGVLSALAGLTMASRTNSVNADYGSSYLLLAILVAILGGVRPEGGFGRVAGLVLAVLSLQFLSSGLNMLRFTSFAKEFVWGILLLLVMVTSRLLGKRRQARRAASS